jgi:hypothetical protein
LPWAILSAVTLQSPCIPRKTGWICNIFTTMRDWNYPQGKNSRASTGQTTSEMRTYNVKPAPLCRRINSDCSPLVKTPRTTSLETLTEPELR